MLLLLIILSLALNILQICVEKQEFTGVLIYNFFFLFFFF